jgi:hypothetical protein
VFARNKNATSWRPSCADWERLKKEEERLEREQELAELSVLQAHQAAIEGLARSQRLKKQRAMLRERGAEMLRRGLKTLDELDTLEQLEREERDHAVVLPPNPALGSLFPLVNSSESEVQPDPAFLSDGFWEDLGFDGGIPQASQGS